MATTITKVESSQVISNLDTYTYTVKQAAMHVARLTINEIPPSGLTITIKQNGSTVVSTSAPAAAQQVVDLSTTLNCAINDTISFVVASTTPSDTGPNAFKGILNIHIGSSN